MITRSAAKSARFSPPDRPSTSVPRRNSLIWTYSDLEEELANPSKSDYNRVREAFIESRAAAAQQSAQLEETTRELQETNRLLSARDHELRRCSETHVEQIHFLRQKLKDVRREEERRRRRDSPNRSPEQQCGTSDGEPTPPEPAILQTLRSSIDDFATTYFGRNLHSPREAGLGAGWAVQYMQATTPGEDLYLDYLLSRRRCPMIIKAFIWRFLCGTVFNGAAWGGSEDIRRHVAGLQGIFSKYYSSPGSDAEQVRKYQRWKLNTTEMVLELLEGGTVAYSDQHRAHLEQHLAEAISEVIEPFIRSSPDGHVGALARIVSQAIDLDKEASQALARASWAFSPGPIECRFDFSLEQEGVMRLHPGERTAEKLPAGTRARVYLVVAPGMTSRGQDDGSLESFQAGEQWLASMEVTCVRPRRQRKFTRADNSSATSSRTPSHSPLPG